MNTQPTSPAQTARPGSARRPPAPPKLGATVTRLTSTTDADGNVPAAPVQGTLALDLHGSSGMPATPELHVVDAGTEGTDEIRAWAARFAQAVVEVLGGDRPLTQLLRWTSARVYSDLGRRVRILARTAPATERLRTVRPQVRSVHVCVPAPGCAEVSVHVRHGQRSRALAARLELADGRWQCTALQFG